MHFNYLTQLNGKHHGLLPFRRGTFERRSLRYPGKNSSSKVCSIIPRTSLDLELDLRAQQTKLETLYEEISQLRELKQR